jgi:uncharacterized membrane protein
VSDAATAPRLAARPAPAGRRAFVDALRGLAVALMVVNHTARWWLDPGLDGREALVYVTMVLAGPTFLLLVGFSLALAWHAARARADRPARVAVTNLRRATTIVLSGVLLNLVVFPDDPLGARVLHSIGLAIVAATAVLPLARLAAGRAALLALAALLFAAFPAAVPALRDWSATHPVAAALLLREFPLFPWLGVVLLGLVLGWGDAVGADDRRRGRRYLALGGAGLLGLAAYAVADGGTPLAARLAFGHDPVLNDYWTAGPMTALGMLGAVLGLLAGTYAVVERWGWRPPGLVVLGRTALVLYGFHLVLVVPLGRDALGLAIHGWGAYAAATTGLLVGLVGVAHAWRRVRPRLRHPAGRAGRVVAAPPAGSQDRAA